MAFTGLKITEQGKNALARAQQGEKLQFLYMAIGDGSINEQVENITQLVHELFTEQFGKIKVEASICVLEADLNNKKLENGFYFREIGIYAKISEDTVLYAYDNAGTAAEYIPAQETQASIEKRMRFNLVINGAESISIAGSSVLYATQHDLEIEQKRLTDHLNLISEISNIEIDALDNIAPGDPGGALDLITTEDIDKIIN